MAGLEVLIGVGRVPNHTFNAPLPSRLAFRVLYQSGKKLFFETDISSFPTSPSSLAKPFSSESPSPDSQLSPPAKRPPRRLQAESSTDDSPFPNKRKTKPKLYSQVASRL